MKSYKHDVLGAWAVTRRGCDWVEREFTFDFVELSLGKALFLTDGTDFKQENVWKCLLCQKKYFAAAAALADRSLMLLFWAKWKKCVATFKRNSPIAIRHENDEICDAYWQMIMNNNEIFSRLFCFLVLPFELWKILSLLLLMLNRKQKSIN